MCVPTTPQHIFLYTCWFLFLYWCNFMPITLAVRDAVRLIPCRRFGNYCFSNLDGGKWRCKLLVPFLYASFAQILLVVSLSFFPPADCLSPKVLKPLLSSAQWFLRPFLLGSAFWPEWDQKQHSHTHVYLYLSCFPLCSSMKLTTGITWQSGQRYFLLFGSFFPGYTFVSYFPPSPLCVPVHLA